MLQTALLAASAFFAFIAAILVWRAPRVRTVTPEDMAEMLDSLRKEIHTETDNLRGDMGDIRGELNEARTQVREWHTVAENVSNSTREESLACFRELHSYIDKNSRESGAAQEKLRAEQERMRTEMRGLLLAEFKNLSDSMTASVERIGGIQNTATDQIRRSQDESFARVNNSLDQVTNRVDRAVNEVQSSLMELARQHNEAKAQTAIQFCEALIGSLGNLRNQIAASLAAPAENQMLAASEPGTVAEPLDESCPADIDATDQTEERPVEGEENKPDSGGNEPF